MDMSFSAADEAFRKEVQQFVRTELPDDIRRKAAEGAELNREEMGRWMGVLGKRGWLATNWDQKDGGPGWTPTQKHIFEEECAAAGAPEIVPFGSRMVGPVLLAFGTEEQKRRYIPGILTAETIWCQGYSEPGAGSDLASLQMSAVRDGDHYVVNGSKIWTTYAHIADMMFALVRTSKEPKKQDGVTCLLIDMKAPGVTVRPLIKLDGRHKFNQEYFEDVRVPVENRVGEEGEGWKIAKFLLGHERSSAAGVAGAVRLMHKVREIAEQERAGDGGRLLDERGFAAKFAALEVRLEGLKLTSARTLADASADRPVGPEASTLKLGMSDIRKDITELAMEAAAYYANPFEQKVAREGWGNVPPIGAGYMHRLAPDYFEYRARSIAGGSNEIQKNIIAKRVLGL